MAIKQAILKSIRLNKEGYLKQPITYVHTTDFKMLSYDPDDNTLYFDSSNQRSFFHEAAHAIFELYYDNESNAYPASNLKAKEEFDIAALETIKNIYKFLIEKNLINTELDQSLSYNEMLFSLKQNYALTSIWLDDIDKVAILGSDFNEFWKYGEFTYNDAFLSCAKYPWVKAAVNERELPFSNACNFINELADYLNICPIDSAFNLLPPNILVLPLAKQVADEKMKIIPESQKDFISQFAHLIYYPEYEYSFELIARVVEFSDSDPEISQIIPPLEDYLTQFTQEINILYYQIFNNDTPLEFSDLGIA